MEETNRMTRFKAAHARVDADMADAWAHAAQACVDGLGSVPEGANLGFAYISDLLAEDVQKIHGYLRDHTGVETWVGSVGIGVCGNSGRAAGGTPEIGEYIDDGGISVLVGTFPEGAFKVFRANKDPENPLKDDIKGWLGETFGAVGIVHGDPDNGDTPDLLEAIAEQSGCYLMGGITSSREACHQLAGRPTGGGVSGVMFSAAVDVAAGLSQGCAPLGEQHVISDCLDNVIIGLNGRPALDVLKEDVGEMLARDLTKLGGYVHAALPIEGSDTNDYLVRELLGIDPRRGWLAVADVVAPGERVMFVRRDPTSAKVDLEREMAALKNRLDGAPQAGLYFSCVARGENMFGMPGAEMDIVKKALGDIPMAGFFAGGEVSNARIYGYTGVVLLFM